LAFFESELHFLRHIRAVSTTAFILYNLVFVLAGMYIWFRNLKLMVKNNNNIFDKKSPIAWKRRECYAINNCCTEQGAAVV